MEQNFDLSARAGDWLVQVDSADQTGQFENSETGQAGTFSLEGAGDELELADFDGVAILPAGVARALQRLGVVVDTDTGE